MVVGTSPPLLPDRVQVEGFSLAFELLGTGYSLVAEKDLSLAAKADLFISLNNHQSIGLGAEVYPTESTPSNAWVHAIAHEAAEGPGS